jgi:FkbM family methyltransferase
MELDSQEWLQIHLLGRDWLEPRTIELYRKLLRPGDIYIDVGAHVGLHALIAHQCVGAQGRVIALEPQPYNCNKILINSQINGADNILVVMAAAGAEDGLIMLHNQARSDKARLTLAGEGVNDVSPCFEVPVMRIDSVCARHSVERVKLLKIDVEGYEREVLAGAEETLAITKNVIFECLPKTDPAAVQDVVRRLDRLGFSLHQIDGSDWNTKVDPIEHNLWACRKYDVPSSNCMVRMWSFGSLCI